MAHAKSERTEKEHREEHCVLPPKCSFFDADYRRSFIDNVI